MKGWHVALIVLVLAAVVFFAFFGGTSSSTTHTAPPSPTPPPTAPAPDPDSAEAKMKKVTPVVEVVSPGAAAGLQRGAQAIDEATERQNKAVEELLGDK